MRMNSVKIDYILQIVDSHLSVPSTIKKQNLLLLLVK